MTVIVTRNVADRIRGFLASAMLEVAPGVYLNARYSSAVRERIWAVLQDWFVVEEGASIVMVWYDPSVPGSYAVQTLGLPPVELVEVDGLLLTKRPVGNRASDAE